MLLAEIPGVGLREHDDIYRMNGDVGPCSSLANGLSGPTSEDRESYALFFGEHVRMRNIIESVFKPVRDADVYQIEEGNRCGTQSKENGFISLSLSF